MISEKVHSGKIKVLFVNDNNQELDALTAGLSDEGFLAMGVRNLTETIETLSNDDFDIALIDLMIPDTNGLKLARMLRSQFPNVKTMLMSDYLLSPVQLAKADTGVVGFVPKPCRLEELASFILKKVTTKDKTRKDTCSNSTSSSSDNPHAPFEVLSLQFSDQQIL